ncbi:mucin-1 isoform X1 [Zootoca vivipara]|uniref:mucin-1 isoform X1 n=1 Tax=Zootoca vivipara TaxID=8524 RepID=UPI0015907853|nr:mucin-1 isoform X1 [Zootoca vivipara]
MERNILQTVGLALMLLALCPGPPILGQTPNSDGIPSPITSTDGLTETSTPGETKTSTTISTTGTPPITSSTESSTTATTSEGTTKSHVTEIFTTPTEGSRETSTPSVENENSTAISPSGTPTITSSTESSATATTPEGTTNSYGTKPPTPSTEGSRETSTPSGETKRSTTGTPPITSSTESSATATTPEGTTKSHATEIFTTSIEGSGENSTSSGENENSTAISPSGTPPITSPTESSATATTFEGTTKSHATEIFTTSTEGSGENSTSSGENENSTATSPPGSQVTSNTTEPPTSLPSKTTSTPATTPTTTSTTPPSLMYYSLSYHIERVFSDDLLNPSSSAYSNLSMTIGKMYNAVYNCSGCPAAGRYSGYMVNSFRPGSVVADTTLWFKEGKPISSEELRTALSQATPEQLQYLKLANIEVRKLESDTPNRPETVPGWGIALLVLVCILLLLALIAFLILIIYWCRRNHRGELDLLSNQDSYHIMSEYPKYNTHGRYVAPGSKPNPYSETLPRNGNAPFSYTNPTMANDEL